MTDKKFTWDDLKKIVNEIPEEQLKEQIIWWGDERGGIIKSVSPLEEDYVNYSEGMEPSSSYKDNKDYENETPEGFLKKGTFILNVD